jgi:hypothetical protein
MVCVPGKFMLAVAHATYGTVHSGRNGRQQMMQLAALLPPQAHLSPVLGVMVVRWEMAMLCNCRPFAAGHGREEKTRPRLLWKASRYPSSVEDEEVCVCVCVLSASLRVLADGAQVREPLFHLYDIPGPQPFQQGIVVYWWSRLPPS